MAVGAGTRNGSSNSFSINRLGSHLFSLLSKSSSSVCTRTSHQVMSPVSNILLPKVRQTESTLRTRTSLRSTSRYGRTIQVLLNREAQREQLPLLVPSHRVSPRRSRSVGGSPRKGQKARTSFNLNIGTPIERSSCSGSNSDGGIRNKVGGMDKEGKEGPEDDYIDNFPLGNDLCRRYKRPSGNVDDTRRPIQTKDPRHFTSTTTSVQHDQDDGR